MNRRLAVLTLTLTAALLLAAISGCSSDPLRPSTGNVRILLTDAPIDLSTVSAVNVTIDEMLLVPADTDEDDDSVRMSMIAGGAAGMTVNLLDYQDGNVVLMASADVPIGDYAKLRLRVAEAHLLMDDDGDPATDDVIEPIFNPSGKVDIPAPFTVAGGGDVEITIDFDAQLSVQVNQTSGNHPYILRPVINLVKVD